MDNLLSQDESFHISIMISHYSTFSVINNPIIWIQMKGTLFFLLFWSDIEQNCPRTYIKHLKKWMKYLGENSFKIQKYPKVQLIGSNWNDRGKYPLIDIFLCSQDIYRHIEQPYYRSLIPLQKLIIFLYTDFNMASVFNSYNKWPL